MSELSQTRFLILDCQTTGMRPSVGHLLELAWASGSASELEIEIESSLLQLPEGAWLPPRVSEVTGIYEKDLKAAIVADEVRSAFLKKLATFESDVKPMALVHYAQFEQPFLADFLASESADEIAGELPFELICTHKIAKKLYPTVPSRNIRGLTGFFGSRIGEIKRAFQHVRATHSIWQGIVKSLAERDIHSVSDLKAFLAEAPPKAKRGEKKVKAPSYEYRVEREKRLALPDRPGIYKMKDKDGAILYVGKATSLKDRVNSYFRGKKGRDPRKLELMAQVWDLEVVECGSALEAALLESDEIKRLDPPYNVSLKGNNRALMFYSRDLESVSLEQDAEHPIGPFRRYNSVDHLRVLVQGMRNGLVANVFYQPIEASLLELGFRDFQNKHPEFDFNAQSIRQHLAYGYRLLKKLAPDDAMLEAEIEAVVESGPISSAHIETESTIELAHEEEELTPEDIVEDLENLYMRAAQSNTRAKKLTRLLWGEVSWTEKGASRSLRVAHGKIIPTLGAAIDSESISEPHDRTKIAPPWQSLTITDFDRMSILLSEIARFRDKIR